MASVSESTGKTSLNSSLKAGLNVLSLDQELTFTQYTRVVLPFDGYIFWVKSDILNPNTSLFNSAPYNKSYFNESQSVTTAAPVLNVKGSVHFATENRQAEDETIGVNTVVFTSQQEIQDFNAINPNLIYIATFQGSSSEQSIRFAFSRREQFYQQAGLHHYRGEAIYPVMFPQVIDDPRQFNNLPIVSNSLPLWLALNQLMPVYPAFLVPSNISPPYATIDIVDTKAIQSAPIVDATGTHTQLVKDTLKITIYGLRNDSALDYQDYVFDYSLNSDTIGIMNMPVIVDEKRKQSELNTIAIKKSMAFEVNYYQSRIQEIARQFILSAIPSFTFE